MTPSVAKSTQRCTAKRPNQETRSKKEPWTPVVGGAVLDPGDPVMMAMTPIMRSVSPNRLRFASETIVTRSSLTSRPRCPSGG